VLAACAVKPATVIALASASLDTKCFILLLPVVFI
jgi:hypothetical protein